MKFYVTPKAIEKDISLTIQQLKNRSIESVLLLLFVDSVYFLDNSLDSLVKNLEKNSFYHLSHEFIANVLDLFRKRIFSL